MNKDGKMRWMKRSAGGLCTKNKDLVSDERRSGVLSR